MTKIYGDQAYNCSFAKEIEKFGVQFEKASKPESSKGFVLVAKRWPGQAVIERTISWSNRRATPFFRRIVKDYEYTTSSVIGLLYLANIQIMLQRIYPAN